LRGFEAHRGSFGLFWACFGLFWPVLGHFDPFLDPLLRPLSLDFRVPGVPEEDMAFQRPGGLRRPKKGVQNHPFLAS
jgi:hypothetical protein